MLKTSKSKKNKGKYDYRSNQTLTAMVWFDKRPLYMLSTIHKPTSSLPTTVLRTQGTGSRIAVDCPPCLPDYQKYMHGVFRGDQMIGYYNIGRRSKRWWKRVFTYCRLLHFECLCAFFCPNLGGIVQSVTPSMPVEFHVCACTAFHFQIMLSQYNDCLSHGQCGVYIPGVHTVGD